jgi:hypothetical protein
MTNVRRQVIGGQVSYLANHYAVFRINLRLWELRPAQWLFHRKERGTPSTGQRCVFGITYKNSTRLLRKEISGYLNRCSQREQRYLGITAVRSLKKSKKGILADALR